MSASAPIETPAAKTLPLQISADIRRIAIILIKPTSYDDDGFPYTFARGVLPSNSLAVLNTLTRRELGQLVPAHIPTEIHVIDEYVARHSTQHDRLLKRFPEAGTRLIVGMVAVQTSQFPHACDLMERWRKRGATCVIGGFHVSGTITMMHDGVNDPNRKGIPCPGTIPRDLQELMDRGTIIFHGEAEAIWGEALGDILAGRPKPLSGRPARVR
jgi:hypothetical protein